MAGFCQIWIPSCGLIAKSLYEALKEEEKEPITWIGEYQKAFIIIIIKEKLMTAPALELHIAEAFQFVHPRKTRGWTASINLNFGIS